MQCFTHESAAAVGACKSCGKGVCRSCAKELGFALACSEACAKEAAEMNYMNQKVKRIYGIGAAQRLNSGVLIWGMFAVFFLGWGILESVRTGRPDWFPLIFGFLALVITVVIYRRSKDTGLQC